MDADRLTMALPAGSWPSVDEPEALLRALEEAADADPTDRILAAAVLWVHGRVSVDDGLDTVVAGVHRDQLVRWDAWTTTWTGHRTDGSLAMVRVLRPTASVVHQRALRREAEALSALLELEEHAGALVCTLPGPSLEPPAEATVEELTRMAGQALSDLVAYESAGIDLPALTIHELRDDPEAGVRVICLSPGVGRMDDAVAFVARTLSCPGDSHVHALLRGLSQMPPASAADAAWRLRTAMVDTLSERRHALLLRWLQAAQLDKRGRLHAAVTGLLSHLPPPKGIGAVGVDLEGRTRVVVARGEGGLWWGPASGTLRKIWSADTGFEAAEARRLLRARAAAPLNPRLQEEVGGDPAYTEVVCRWVAAGLRLRTVRLLLERTSNAPWPV